MNIYIASLALLSFSASANAGVNAQKKIHTVEAVVDVDDTVGNTNNLNELVVGSDSVDRNLKTKNHKAKQAKGKAKKAKSKNKKVSKATSLPTPHLTVIPSVQPTPHTLPTFEPGTGGMATSLSLKPSDCPAGERKEQLPPSWFASCKDQGGKGAVCPAGCGTCKPPNFSQLLPGEKATCACAGADGKCTAACGWPGKDTTKKCSAEPCREDNVGCIKLGDNCGGDVKTKCNGPSGNLPFGSCGYSASPTSSCIAFCTQVPGRSTCETTRFQNSVVPSTAKSNPCPVNVLTKIMWNGKKNPCASIQGIDFLDSRYNRCKNSGVKCPYPPPIAGEGTNCATTTIKPQIPDRNIRESNLKPPTLTCPALKNKGSEGFPAAFTNPQVPSDASITCQNACACNDKAGFGPPGCFYASQNWPGPTDCCYCDGKNIAWDKTKYDRCGNYLPIYGPGTVPDQYECYNQYALKEGLVNNFPEPKKYECKAIAGDEKNLVKGINFIV